MKQTGLILRLYASDHDGRFPYHTNGYGDALLLLVKSDGYSGPSNDWMHVALITGPGDDGHVFKEALKTGGHVPEEKCSRVYVQGLSEPNPRIAILFDKHSTRGGDHFPGPFRPWLREVCMADGSMQIVRDEQWPEFSRRQIELLVQAGIPRETAEAYYKLK